MITGIDLADSTPGLVAIETSNVGVLVGWGSSESNCSHLPQQGMFNDEALRSLQPRGILHFLLLLSKYSRLCCLAASLRAFSSFFPRPCPWLPPAFTLQSRCSLLNETLTPTPPTKVPSFLQNTYSLANSPSVSYWGAIFVLPYSPAYYLNLSTSNNMAFQRLALAHSSNI